MLVFDPRSIGIIIFENINKLMLIIWWVVFTLRLAFGTNTGNLENLNWIEHLLDAIFLFEILFTFFIGIPVDEMSAQART